MNLLQKRIDKLKDTQESEYVRQLAYDLGKRYDFSTPEGLRLATHTLRFMKRQHERHGDTFGFAIAAILHYMIGKTLTEID